MSNEDQSATEAELHDAALLADALETPERAGRDVAPVEDVLATAWMVRASRADAASALRARYSAERVWPPKRRRALTPASIAAAAALVVAVFLATRPRGPANLPPPDSELLRAQLDAARPHSGLALNRMEDESAAYRERLFLALRRTYGSGR